MYAAALSSSVFSSTSWVIIVSSELLFATIPYVFDSKISQTMPPSIGIVVLVYNGELIYININIQI